MCTEIELIFDNFWTLRGPGGRAFPGAVYLCMYMYSKGFVYGKGYPNVVFAEVSWGHFWPIFGAKMDSGPLLQNCCSDLLTGSRGSILVALESCAARA